MNALQQALAAHQQGDLATAVAGYRAVLVVEPDQPDAMALLGVALDAQGQKSEGEAMIRRAIELDSKAALFRIYLGNMLAGRRDWDGAIESFRAAAALAPDYADIYYNLGNALRCAERFPEAEEAYQQTIRLRPDHILARNNLALVYEKQKRTGEALAVMEAIVRETPAYLEGWLNLSSLTEKSGFYDRAFEAAQKARDMAPQDARGWFGMGVALSRMARDEETLAFYKKALELKPEWTEVWDNLGQSYQLLNDLENAEKAFRQCIVCAGQVIEGEGTRFVDETEYGNRHWHLALLELLKGDYKSGFARYRSRFEELEGLAREPWPRPVWHGEDIQGKTILIMDEQGMGDCLMMARYLPLLKARGARVWFYIAKALVPLFEGWDGADLIVPKGDKIPDFDFYASIFDLPFAFGTALETVPANIPYLPRLAPDAATQVLPEGRPKIGVVWAGTPLHKHDAKRSISLNVFKELFNESACRFYSFNRDKRDGDEALLASCGVVDLAPRLNNFADTSRLMGQMDLIVTCDTSTAHLAGGMGIKVWTLLPFAPDWRWMLEREDTPWYPTMRLFRQKKPRDWEEVVSRVRRRLRESFPASS